MTQEDLRRQLSGIILGTKGRHELEVLLEGLLTPQELEEIIMRWQLLCLLDEGETQRDIAHKLGISLGKIARGSRLLKYGPEEFRELFRRLQANSGE